jgi:hypothetical protein
LFFAINSTWLSAQLRRVYCWLRLLRAAPGCGAAGGKSWFSGGLVAAIFGTLFGALRTDRLQPGAPDRASLYVYDLQHPAAFLPKAQAAARFDPLRCPDVIALRGSDSSHM